MTPNIDEAEMLVGEPIETPTDAERAGRELVSRGVDAALIKGGHLDGDETVVDTLVRGGGEGDALPTVTRVENPRVATDATHGSGCTLSSAIAARLARDEPLPEAVATAVGEMGTAIRRGYHVGEGPGAVNPTMLDGGDLADRSE